MITILARKKGLKIALSSPSAALRVAALVSACTLLLGIVLSWVFVSNQSRLIGAHARDYSTLLTEQLARNAVEPLFTDEHYTLQPLLDLITDSGRILGAAIYDTEGRVLAQQGSLPPHSKLRFDAPYQELDQELGQGLSNEDKEASRTGAHSISVHIEPVQFKGATAGYAVVSYSQTALTRSTRQSVTAQASLTFLMCLLLFVTVYLFLKRFLRPLSELLDASLATRAGHFTRVAITRQDEIGALVDAVNEMNDGLQHKAQLEELMEQMLDKSIANTVKDDLQNIMDGGRQIHASVLFADIVGFTSISEELSPREVSTLLNEYFTYLEACAKFYFGSIDKFIGDCVMIVFGAADEDPQHQYNAVACGVLMQRLVQRLNEQRQKEGKFTVDLRIGINSGQMLAGLLGSRDRLEYTVVGDAVNLASRLCNEAEKSQVIIEQSLYEAVSADREVEVSAHKQIKVRGKSEAVTIYDVRGIEQLTPLALDHLINDIAMGKRAA